MMILNHHLLISFTGFRVEKASKFKKGLVFKILWLEPRGQRRDRRGSDTEVTDDEAPSTRGFAKTRRFLIVNTFPDHCICLPLLTYSGLGTRKHRVRGHEHAAVFTGTKEVLAPGEADNGLRPPIRVIPNTPEDKLDPMTRINYAKVYTVEYNVPVRFIGRIDGKSSRRLVSDYNAIHQAVWDPSEEDDSFNIPDPPMVTSVDTYPSNNSGNSNSTSVVHTTSSTYGQPRASFSSRIGPPVVHGKSVQGSSKSEYGEQESGSSGLNGQTSSLGSMVYTGSSYNQGSYGQNPSTKPSVGGSGSYNDSRNRSMDAGPSYTASYDHYDDIYDDED
jgi:hypothetical protein